MNMADLCTRGIVSITASATVRQAAALMRDEHVGVLAVTDPYETGRVIAVVTDRDLVVDVLAAGHAVEGQAIGAVAHGDLAGVPASASVHDAVEAMHRSGVRRLLVMGENHAVVGVVSMDDLVGAVAEELDALAATLRDGVLREGSRLRARARAEAESPRALYITRNEP